MRRMSDLHRAALLATLLWLLLTPGCLAATQEDDGERDWLPSWVPKNLFRGLALRCRSPLPGWVPTPNTQPFISMQGAYSVSSRTAFTTQRRWRLCWTRGPAPGAATGLAMAGGAWSAPNSRAVTA